MNREDVAKRNASIVRDMRNGMRIRDVMKKYDVSRYTCYRTMQSVNRKERQANYSDWKAKRDEEIVNRYADGVPAEQYTIFFLSTTKTICDNVMPKDRTPLNWLVKHGSKHLSKL